MSKYYLPEGLPAPVPENDDLSKPYWEGLKAGKLMVQKCNGCGQHQFGPEWICHNCNSFDLDWVEVEGRGRAFWELNNPEDVARIELKLAEMGVE